MARHKPRTHALTVYGFNGLEWLYSGVQSWGAIGPLLSINYADGATETISFSEIESITSEVEK